MMTNWLRQLALYVVSVFASIIVGWLLMDQAERAKRRHAAAIMVRPATEPPPAAAPTREPTQKPAPAKEMPAAPAPSKPSNVSSDDTSTKPDDLTLIEGIGPAYAKALNAAGITTFAELAKQTPAKLAAKLANARVNAERIRSQNWIGQAKKLSQK